MHLRQERRSAIPVRPQWTAVRPRGYLLTLARLAIGGQVVFLASVLLLPSVSEYSLVGDHVSELALGRYGVVQTVAFVIVGLATLALAFAIRTLTRGLRGSLVGSLSIALNGAGAILAAIFPTDRIDSPTDVWSQSPTGLIHVGVSIASFLCVVLGMLVLTWTFARAVRWRSLALWSGLLASGALALMFVQAEGPRVGLMQRLQVGVTATWMIVVATRVHALATSEQGTVDVRPRPRL